jgi:hypothetical protein
MTEINPYAAPSATLVTPPAPASGGTFVPGGRVLNAAAGYDWVRDGFRLFFKLPAHFYIAMISHLILNIVVNFVPLVGPILGYIAAPLFSAGYFAAGDALKRTQTPDISVMFLGFNKKPTQLLMVGFVAFCGFAVSLVAGGLIAGAGLMMTLFRGGTPDFGELFGVQVLLGALVGLMLIIPVSMATWLAPGLVILNDLEPLEAMKQSFNACLKNFVPYLIYGLVSTGVVILAVIPLGLGLFVAIPAFVASFYPQYASIFTVGEGESQPPVT